MENSNTKKVTLKEKKEYLKRFLYFAGQLNDAGINHYYTEIKAKRGE